MQAGKLGILVYGVGAEAVACNSFLQKAHAKPQRRKEKEKRRRRSDEKFDSVVVEITFSPPLSSRLCVLAALRETYVFYNPTTSPCSATR